MSVMTFEEVNKTLNKLEKRGKLGTSDAMMYFVSPFLQSLGYNTFDVDEVDVRNADGEVSAKIADDLNLIVSLYGHFPLEAKKDRIFLSMLLDERKIKLYFKVLGDWEQIVSLDLKKDKSDKYTHQLVRRIMKEQVIQSYRTKGEKFLTENVFDSMVESGKWDNDFMLLGLLEELRNPSREFINVMATRMNKDYTTKDRDWIVKNIKPMETKGLVSLIEKMIDRGYIGENQNKDGSDSNSEDVGSAFQENDVFNPYGEQKEENSFKSTVTEDEVRNEKWKEEYPKKEAEEKKPTTVETILEPKESQNDKPQKEEEKDEDDDLLGLTFGEPMDEDTLDFGEELTFGEDKNMDDDEFINFKEDDGDFGDDDSGDGNTVDLTGLLNR